MKKIKLILVVLGAMITGTFAQEKQGEILDLAKQWGKIMEENALVQKTAATEKAQVILEIKSCEKNLDAAKTDKERVTRQTELLALHEKKNSLKLKQVRATKKILGEGYSVLREMNQALKKQGTGSEAFAKQELKVKKVLSAAAQVLKSDALTDAQRAQVEDTVILMGQLNRVRKVQGQDTADIGRTLEMFENTIVQLEVVEQLLQNQRQVLTVQTHRLLVATALKRLGEFNGGKGMENFALDMAMDTETDMDSIKKTSPAGSSSTPRARRNRSQAAQSILDEYLK